jgi:hypothetical protein
MQKFILLISVLLWLASDGQAQTRCMGDYGNGSKKFELCYFPSSVKRKGKKILVSATNRYNNTQQENGVRHDEIGFVLEYHTKRNVVRKTKSIYYLNGNKVYVNTLKSRWMDINSGGVMRDIYNKVK